VCGKRLTIGVMHRVEVLADRKRGFKPAAAALTILSSPCSEVLAEARGVGANSKVVQDEYMNLLARLGNELTVLVDTPLAEIERSSVFARG